MFRVQLRPSLVILASLFKSPKQPSTGKGPISRLACSDEMAACVVESLEHGLADRAQVSGKS